MPERNGPSGFSGYIPALDGVRGLAILMVLLFHFVTPTGPTDAVDRAISWLFAYGALGVDLFFVLSGFLITGILYDSHKDPAYFRNFYMRRLLRIFPLYYGVLVIVFFVIPAIPALRDSEIAGLREQQAWAWLYGVNIYLAIHGGWVLSYIEHFWSLAVEEHFYLVWPFLVWLLAARRNVFLGFSLLLAALSLGSRVAASMMGVNEVATTVLTPFQLDALALGGFLAVYLRQPDGKATARRTVLPLAAAGAVLIALQFAVRHFTSHGAAVQPLRIGAFHMLLAALLLHVLGAPEQSPTQRVFCSAPLRFLGKYSYGLYVYHHFFSYYCVTHGTDRIIAKAVGSHVMALAIQAAAGIGVSIVLAWLSFEYFEKRFLGLKRFWQSPRGTAGSRA